MNTLNAKLIKASMGLKSEMNFDAETCSKLKGKIRDNLNDAGYRSTKINGETVGEHFVLSRTGYNGFMIFLDGRHEPEHIGHMLEQIKKAIHLAQREVLS